MTQQSIKFALNWRPLPRLAEFAFALSGCLLAAAAHAQMLTLRGAIGNYPIVMEVSADGEDGHYFYEKYKQDISLRGEQDADTWRLRADWFDGADDDAVEKFVLSRTGDAFTGTYTSAKGATLPVKLHIVPTEAVPDLKVAPARRDAAWSDYERIKLADLNIVAGEKQTIDAKYQIQWQREPLSGFALFHVISGYPEAIMASINQIIDRDYYDNLSGYFSCSQESGPGIDSLTASLELLNERFVSYTISSSWFCAGAAHPDFGTAGTTIDAKTGKELTLDDVYWLGSGVKPAQNSDAWYAYHRDTFAPAIVNLFQQLYPQHMQGGGDGDGCDYSEADLWTYASAWHLSAQGLYVGAYFPRVMKACDEPDWSFIPYSLLQENNPALFGN
ncbi:MAG: hypothetical protein LBF16_11595 [Pseudomonadales bacterium]|jgi:hypothetical protein|nr:hypothetical protein [Pseudomonadales bacterium]